MENDEIKYLKSNIKINKATKCWIWFSVKEGNYGPYRRSFEAFKGPIPKKKLVRHTCDDKRCINPKHLIIGTKKSNRRDFMERHPRAKELMVELNKALLKYQKTDEGVERLKKNGKAFFARMTDEEKFNFCSAAGIASFSKLSEKEIFNKQSNAAKIKHQRMSDEEEQKHMLMMRKKRNEKLTKAERSAIASLAAKAKWDGKSQEEKRAHMSMMGKARHR